MVPMIATCRWQIVGGTQPPDKSCAGGQHCPKVERERLGLFFDVGFAATGYS